MKFIYCQILLIKKFNNSLKLKLVNFYKNLDMPCRQGYLKSYAGKRFAIGEGGFTLMISKRNFLFLYKTSYREPRLQGTHAYWAFPKIPSIQGTLSIHKISSYEQKF